ncbi:MAG: hypothetical protein WCW03_03490 [Candidatus Paceibacterota bacterium]
MKGKNIDERVKDYLEIRMNTAELYASFKKVYSPALAGDIHFTSEGFNHLIYERARKERDKRTQILRFDMLEKAKFILETSTTYQEYEEDMEYQRVNRHGKFIGMNVAVRYWGFVAIVNKFRVKVVVRQVGNGKMEFQSVIPAWFIKQYREIKLIQNSTGTGLVNENDEEVLKNATESDVL